jgi:hypothetical protein
MNLTRGKCDDALAKGPGIFAKGLSFSIQLAVENRRAAGWSPWTVTAQATIMVSLSTGEAFDGLKTSAA